MNHKHEAIWPLKKCKWYILFYPPFQLVIGLRLILIQNELWVSKCYHANSKVFFLCLGLKDIIKILAYYVSQYLLYIFLWKLVHP